MVRYAGSIAAASTVNGWHILASMLDRVIHTSCFHLQQSRQLV